MAHRLSEPRHGRRRLLLAGQLGLAGLLILFWASCVSSVRPPEEVPDPVRVFALTEARHGGLVLPDGPGRFVEYGYGEWRWYALGRDSWYEIFGTLLLPTRGTLSRRVILARDERELRDRRAPGELHALEVDRERAAELAARLDASFAARSEESLRREDFDASFVPSERSFCLFHNCHDALAEWLRELGCRVSRAPIRGGIALRHPPRE